MKSNSEKKNKKGYQTVHRESVLHKNISNTVTKENGMHPTFFPWNIIIYT